MLEVCADAWVAKTADVANSAEPNKAKAVAKASDLRGMVRASVRMGATGPMEDTGGCYVTVVHNSILAY